MTEYETIQRELEQTNERILGLCGNTARAPLVAKANGLKAQLKAFTAYGFSGYRYGSTNGQRPLAHCIVVTKGSKADAQAAALRQMRTYKVLGYRYPRMTNVVARATMTADLFKQECPIIET